MEIAVEPIANLVASTSGTDGRFVVKLIDVYPTWPIRREPEPVGVSASFHHRYRLDAAKHGPLMLSAECRGT